jgi:signal transduction histidine kinase
VNRFISGGNRRLAVLLISVATGGYVLVFSLFYPMLGSPLIALSLAPVMLVGWLWGLYAGLLAGVSLTALNALLFYATEPQWEKVLMRGGPGHLALIFIGGVIGWLSQLLQRLRLQSQLLIDERQALKNQIAERRRAEAALQTAKEAAEAANHAKSAFISMVSHELNTPMGQITGYIDLLIARAAGPLTEEQLLFLRTILVNVERMSALVNDLAEISQIESGNFRLRCRALSLREVLDEVVPLHYSQIEKKAQTLQIEVAPELPAVLADRGRLIQILTNLLSNAHKYTPSQGHIAIQANPVAGLRAVHIRVQDTGIGIKPEDQAKIFEKFYRSNDPESHEIEGTGLGLAIVKLLVEAHGGHIWCESKLRSGTAIHCTLPAASATAVPQAPHTIT